MELALEWEQVFDLIRLLRGQRLTPNHVRSVLDRLSVVLNHRDHDRFDHIDVQWSREQGLEPSLRGLVLHFFVDQARGGKDYGLLVLHLSLAFLVLGDVLALFDLE